MNFYSIHFLGNLCPSAALFNLSMRLSYADNRLKLSTKNKQTNKKQKKKNNFSFQADIAISARKMLWSEYKQVLIQWFWRYTFEF